MKKQHFIKFIVLALALCLLAGILAGCSSKGKVLMSLGEHEITVNEYQLFLSRYKATLAYNDYDVEDIGFWNTVIDKETQSTYDDYFCQKILENCKTYLVVLYLFDEEGLELTDAEIEKIDKKLDDLIELDGDGSKSSLNMILADYGVNYKILRDVYILQAKYDALLKYYYGDGASQISSEIKDEFLEDNYYAFKQCFLPYYYYVYETDENGDEIYYNSKTNEYLYDTEKGSTKKDEHGLTVKDKFGNAVYYNEDGSIAYDTENGKRAEVDKNSDGNCDTAYYDSEKKKNILKEAEALKSQAIEMNMSSSLFEAMIDEYSGADNIYQYLRAGVTYAYDYIDDISSELKDMEIGDIAMVESDYGCHIIMKYKVENGAYGKDENKQFFSNFADDLMQELLAARCEPHLSKVEVVESVLASAPNLKEVNPNYYY